MPAQITPREDEDTVVTPIYGHGGGVPILAVLEPDEDPPADKPGLYARKP